MNVTRLLVLAAAATAFACGGAAAQQRIGSDFNLEETVEICTACHGDHGIPVSEDIPILWGQQFYYLYVQLKDYKAGRRANEIMEPIASDFDKDQMKALAQYFADKKWPKIKAVPFTGDEGKVQRLMVDGQCSACHGNFMGDSRVPRVAGQQYAYISKTMLDLRDDVRKNAAAMAALMRSFSDDDIESLSRYLASR